MVGVELVPGVEEESSLGRILLPPSGSLLILFGGLGVGRGGGVPEPKMYYLLGSRNFDDHNFVVTTNNGNISIILLSIIVETDSQRRNSS